MEDIMNSYHDFTIEDIDDPIRFIEKFVKINGPKGLDNFSLYSHQKVAIRSYNRNNKTVGIWARQMGCTYTTLAYILWYATRHSNATIGIVAPKLSYCNNMARIIKGFHHYLPSFIKHDLEVSNEKEICFCNGSKILFISAQNAIYAMRGRGFNLIYIEQAAFINRLYEVLETTAVHLCTGNKLIMSSSYNETAVTFNNFYSKCKRRERLKIKWHKLKGRDKKFKEEMIKILGEDNFNREYNLK